MITVTKSNLDDNIMMQMKYPSLDQFIKNNFEINDKNMQWINRLI